MSEQLAVANELLYQIEALQVVVSEKKWDQLATSLNSVDRLIGILQSYRATTPETESIAYQTLLGEIKLKHSQTLATLIESKEVVKQEAKDMSRTVKVHQTYNNMKRL